MAMGWEIDLTSISISLFLSFVLSFAVAGVHVCMVFECQLKIQPFNLITFNCVHASVCVCVAHLIIVNGKRNPFRQQAVA